MGTDDIWSNYIRYIGAGAVAAGGIINLARALPTIIDSFRASFRDLRKMQGEGGASGDTDGNSDPDHCRLLGRGPSRLRRHIPSGAGTTRQLSEKPYLRQAVTCRKLAALPRARPPSGRN